MYKGILDNIFSSYLYEIAHELLHCMYYIHTGIKYFHF